MQIDNTLIQLYQELDSYSTLPFFLMSPYTVTLSYGFVNDCLSNSLSLCVLSDVVLYITASH